MISMIHIYMKRSSTRQPSNDPTVTQPRHFGPRSRSHPVQVNWWSCECWSRSARLAKLLYTFWKTTRHPEKTQKIRMILKYDFYPWTCSTTGRGDQDQNVHAVSLLGFLAGLQIMNMTMRKWLIYWEILQDMTRRSFASASGPTLFEAVQMYSPPSCLWS